MTETYLPPRQPPVPPWNYPTPNYLPPQPPTPPAPPSGQPQPPRNRFRRNTIALLAAATLAAGGIGGTIGALVAGDDGGTATTPVAASSTSDTKATDVSAVVDKVRNSVVQVNMRTANAQGIGSGVIISADGRILTNNHVVAGAEQLTVTLADGREVPASVVGTDPASDLAVIQAKGVSGLTVAKFGDSDAVHVGDEVIAIGSPGGLQGTVTTGIVSALDREVKVPAEEQQPQEQQGLPFGVPGQGNGGSGSGSGNTVTYHAIQTDASINQGNSGGPLFDSAGEVIGINSAMYSPVSGPDGSAGSVGIGFAIPSNDAQKVIDKL
ncbi:MAG: trypsin-like serine protease [Actinophytocola sp.]|uniref:S1C family serine protease n=1 Tax=Actinophytocola sp. TaxID=1872138 RepID=UPI0013246DBA|nr:trypsin-like peptidase domain-containing protein [Actinophytocola sp.]MPZ84393.1 trypsin-like serine protease [Actinophytocola sp.]